MSTEPTSADTTSAPRPRQIDPRGPRFGAALTSVLLAVVFVVSLTGHATPALILLALAVVLFALGASGAPVHPWSLLYARIVRPRLGPATELEDVAPPRFAQLVGLVVTAIGLVLGLAGVSLGVTILAGVALVAALLNATIGLCLGCLLYGLLLRFRTDAPAGKAGA